MTNNATEPRSFAVLSDYRPQPGYRDAPERPNTVKFFGHTVTAQSIVHTWNATSHFPESRAALAILGLGQAINEFAEFVVKTADGAEVPLDVPGEVERFAEGYLSKWRAWISAEARCMSSFITGGSNFPVRRAEKANASTHNRLKDLAEFTERARKSVTRKAYPYGDGSEIRSGYPDAVEKLEHRIAELERMQEGMKAVNAAYRAHAKDPQSKRALSLMADLDEGQRRVIKAYKPAYSWEPNPYAPYQLSNNNANINRLRQRLDGLKATKSAETTPTSHTTKAGNIEVIENAEAMRIQIIFPDKPSSGVRAVLKQRGFRWAPSQGAWQRHLNQNGRWAANAVIAALTTA